jgi:hypothetical protein
MESNLKSGLIRIGIALPLMFIGPILFTIGLKAWNQDKIVIILILGIIVSFAALFCAITALRAILKYLFK